MITLSHRYKRMVHSGLTDLLRQGAGCARGFWSLAKRPRMGLDCMVLQRPPLAWLQCPAWPFLPPELMFLPAVPVPMISGQEICKAMGEEIVSCDVRNHFMEVSVTFMEVGVTLCDPASRVIAQ